MESPQVAWTATIGSHVHDVVSIDVRTHNNRRHQSMTIDVLRSDGTLVTINLFSSRNEIIRTEGSDRSEDVRYRLAESLARHHAEEAAARATPTPEG